MDTFTIKQNDTRPLLTRQLLDENGDAVDLTTADEVVFHMRGVITDGVCTIDDAAGGEVSYEWQTGDTATVGEYEGEFEVHWTDGGIQTFPNPGYLQISVGDDVA